MSYQQKLHVPEIPGSLVSELKHRDCRVRTRNCLGIKTKISAWVVLDSELEPGFQLVNIKLWNQCEHFNSSSPGLCIGTEA